MSYEKVVLQIKNHKLLLFFIFLIFILTMTPSIAPAFFVKPGYVWTTLNDGNNLGFDATYYASGVKEVVSGNVLIRTQENLLSCETARILPYWIAAIPFLFFDFNISYPLSISLCVIAIFSIMYNMYRKIQVNTYSALIFSFIVLYFVQFWSSMPFSGHFPVSDFINNIFGNMKHQFKTIIFLRDYILNVNYRFINSCAANVLLLFNIFIALRFVAKASWVNSCLLFVSALTMLFTYPSHTVVSGVFMLSCFIYLFLGKEFRKIYILIAAGISLVMFIFMFDYFSFIKSTYCQSFLLKSTHSYFNTGIVLKPISVNLVLHAILNKYCITYPIFIYCFREHLYGKLFLIFYFGLLMVASTAFFIDSHIIYDRLTTNGIDMLWFFGLVYAVGTIIQKMTAYISSRKLQTSLLIAISSLFIIVPTIGFLHAACARVANGSGYQSANQAAMVRWAADHLKKNEVIAALDFSDAHFLTYAGKYLNFISYIEVQKIGIEESLLRYIAVAKLCHMTHQEFASLTTDTVEVLNKIDGSLWLLPKRPFLNPKDFQHAAFVGMLMYYPYITKAWGINIYADQLVLGNFKVTEEFERKLMDTFDKLDVKSYFSEHPIDYVFVSSEVYGQIIIRLKSLYPIAFENNYGAIFKISKTKKMDIGPV